MLRSSDNIIKRSFLNVRHFLKRTNRTLGVGSEASVHLKTGCSLRVIVGTYCSK